MNEAKHSALVERKRDICSCSQRMSEQIGLVLITVIVTADIAPLKGHRSLLADIKATFPCSLAI